MRSARSWRGPFAFVAVVVSAAAIFGCSATTSDTSGSSATMWIGEGTCPVDAVDVVVTVNQWADIVEQLGGACTRVTTVIASSAVDPHDYEPTPGDAATFSTADLVVVNGLGYDTWATKIVDTLPSPPAVVDAGQLAGRTDGDNPHVWYDPETISDVAHAATTELKGLAPGAGDYFDERAGSFDASLQPYRDAIAALRTSVDGQAYAATESVFDDMAAAVGLVDLTPDGYRQSIANGSDPAPGDLAAFRQIISDRKITVLVVNTQTEGAVPEQLRTLAERTGVPVVEVTESVPEGADGFVAWQMGQLHSLARALGVGS